MKKKVVLFILAFLAYYHPIFAQKEFKVAAKKDATLKVKTIHGNLNFEPHNGSEIIIQTREYAIPEKAQGLRAITGDNEDNTGIGLNVQDVEGGIQISAASRRENDYTILIPNGMAINLKTQGYNVGNYSFKNISSEIEADVQYGDIYLQNVTGPVVLNATYGKIEAVFGQVNQQKPTSIIAAYGDVDVTLPTDTKASLTLKSSYGDIFTDMNISYSPKEGGNEMKTINSNKIEGNINGGGVKIHIESPYQNIYLRKK